MAKSLESSASDAPPKSTVAKGTRGRPRRKNKKPRSRKPRDMPSRPLSAYNLFFRDERVRFLQDQKKEALPTSTDPGGSTASGGKKLFYIMGKEIGRRWQELNDQERSRYHKLAEADTHRYRIEIEEYNKKVLQRSEAEASACKPAYGDLAGTSSTMASLSQQFYNNPLMEGGTRPNLPGQLGGSAAMMSLAESAFLKNVWHDQPSVFPPALQELKQQTSCLQQGPQCSSEVNQRLSQQILLKAFEDDARRLVQGLAVDTQALHLAQQRNMLNRGLTRITLANTAAMFSPTVEFDGSLGSGGMSAYNLTSLGAGHTSQNSGASNFLLADSLQRQTQAMSLTQGPSPGSVQHFHLLQQLQNNHSHASHAHLPMGSRNVEGGP